MIIIVFTSADLHIDRIHRACLYADIRFLSKLTQIECSISQNTYLINRSRPSGSPAPGTVRASRLSIGPYFSTTMAFIAGVEGCPYKVRVTIELERRYQSVSRRSGMDHFGIEVRTLLHRTWKATAGLIQVSGSDGSFDIVIMLYMNVMNTIIMM